MYIVPTEIPPWFEEHLEYDMIQITNNQIEVFQENDSEFFGYYTITLELTYEDQWKITSVKIK